jgi:hypothetical protein
VGVQFWRYGEGEQRGRTTTRDDEVIVVNDHGIRKRLHMRWRRASGWMRGWQPSVSVAGTPNVSRATTPVQTPRVTSPSPSPSRSMNSERGALDEARALLGTSPRTYGGT